jgi:hypothetical protein
MIINAADINNQEIYYDVAIIGSGAAGTTLAFELERSGLKVGVFESGGFEYDKRTQDLYKGYVSGRLIHAPLDTFRMRFFGGSTNCWGGSCVPYDEIDFQEKSYLNHSGWPLQYLDIQRYYHRSVKYLDIDSFDQDQDHEEIISGIEKSKIFTTKYWKRAANPQNFNSKYRELFAISTSVDLFLKLNLIRLESTDGSNKIQQCYFQNFSNETIKVKANKFILAMGGIEGTRLLLNSKNLFTNPVLEKVYGNIGRYYSPHINIEHGTFVPSPGVRVLSEYEAQMKGIEFRRFLTINENAIKKYELLNCKTILQTIESQSAPLVDEIFEYLNGRNLFDLGDESIDGYNNLIKSYLPDRFLSRLTMRRKNSFVLDTAFEQEPNYNSKIELVNDKDEFGLKKVKLTFDVKDSDIKRYLKYYKLLSLTVGEYNLGRFSYDETGQVFFKQVSGKSHHTGATRMSLNYRDGVVDSNCKVHGIENLFISSASVFPTPGHANPTLTIVGMAIRLADYIKETSL